MRPDAAYAELIRRVREESLLASCVELLGWDEDTYMPAAGVEHRARQQALLAGILHEKSSDPAIGDLLNAVEGSALTSDPHSPSAVNIREIRRAHDRETRLPRKLVEETARVTTFAEQRWAEARRRVDFRSFRPWLEKVVVLSRRYAEAAAPEAAPYDALLDYYEPGLTSAAVSELFDALRQELIPLANALTHAARRPDNRVLAGPFPIDQQEALVKRAAQAIGFDFHSGRLDTTTHPFFSAIGPGDVRLTTRFRRDDFGDGFFCTLHEAGHGLYEQGLPAEHHGTPAGLAASVGLHESQARLWENAVGRSKAFWRYFYPLAQSTFPGPLRNVSLDQFHFALNSVEATYIRARADEVTYNLHVLIRFQLERALIEGDLRIGDLPEAWNEAYRHFLGLRPRNDAEGCLQDGHWAAGMFGYFPTYTLGNIFSAQLFEAARRQGVDGEAEFAQGRFDRLHGWLCDRIYQQGGTYSAIELVERVSGRKPDHRPLLTLLRQKYGELYGL